MSYEVNYNDERFKDVETDKKQAINEIEKTYGEMIGQTDSYYQAQINAAKDWEKKQTELQNQQTDFAIQEIEQQKTQAKKDYTKEQSGAYVDWKKQSDQYGARAEQIADRGLLNDGYAESSQVSMYNTYQNRVTAARESYNLAVQNYNNAITEARLQNNSALAEIAYNSLQQQLELSLQGFQYKNTLLLDKMGKKTELENEYYARYQDVLAQINTENALAEQVRQYNESMAFQREQFAWQKAQAKKSSSGGGGGSSRRSSGGGGGTTINKSGSGFTGKSGKIEDKTGDTMSAAISAGNTDKANKLADNLATMSGQTGSHEAIANSITAYAATGKVNTNEAAYMYKKLGYDPNKYLK